MNGIDTASAARQAGDDFQTRLFWQYASRMLGEDSSIARVTYEPGEVRGFDDIRVDYRGDKIRNKQQQPVIADHIQAKWHVTPGSFGYQDLVDPAFIGSKGGRSILGNLKEAWRTLGQDQAARMRFFLVTPWRFREHDKLAGIFDKSNDRCRIEHLFEAKGYVKLRQYWMNALQLTDEAELRAMLDSFYIAERPHSLEGLQRILDAELFKNGLKPVPEGQDGSPYDSAIRASYRAHHNSFDRQALLDLCRRNNLIGQQGRVQLLEDVVGIRSFLRFGPDMADEVEDLLCLNRFFSDRAIKRDLDWQGQILPKMRSFLASHVGRHPPLRLALDAHASIAFACGVLLDVKSGQQVWIKQRGLLGIDWWRHDQGTALRPALSFEEEVIDASLPEVAVALSVANDVGQGLRSYLTANPGRIGKILHARPPQGASQTAVSGGAHAWAMAEELAQKMLDIRGGPGWAAHLFASAPNALMFALGQRHAAFGCVTTYEFDFEGRTSLGYTPAFTFD